ncbi:MAG: hypothetical protein IPK03_03830 [Bacteroidetes bacterium]|nr:hypothetical protein [Bacteroidota bacterium]
MNSLPLFAIIDVETSGGKPHQSRITEIAIYITDGKEIIEEYSTLVNPQTKIDYYVVQLTGITDKMVEQAPTFEQVCHEVEEILKDKIFVAHNVEFDFGMVKKEMYRSGKSLMNPKLCTVKLAKKYFPTSASYSLGNICEHLSIPHMSKHRAGGDALATVQLFHKIYDQFESHTLHIELLDGLDIDKLPDNISIDTINQLPELNGIVYLKDHTGEIIYIMACKNIYTSFIKLLKQSEIAPNKRKLIESIVEVDFEVSTNYLQTLLQKYYLVKELKPRFNKRTNIKSYTHEVFVNYDEQGFAFLDNQKLDENNTALKVKTTSKRGSEKLISNIIKYQKLESVLEQLPAYKGAV